MPFGFPASGITPAQFYKEALNIKDSDTRRRLFADARQSNICSHEVYVLAAQAEEHWRADKVELKTMVAKGITVFKNPSGQSEHCPRVGKAVWLQAAAAAQTLGSVKTAAALREAVAEIFDA
ncbi:hypothetical protein BG004_004943 [Podila humilis]|nr:hypothetical protein BG004_004943 [Podila humilis]